MNPDGGKSRGKANAAQQPDGVLIEEEKAAGLAASQHQPRRRVRVVLPANAMPDDW